MEAQLVFSSEWVKNKNVLISSIEYDCLDENKRIAQEGAIILSMNIKQAKIRDYATQHVKPVVNKRIKQ